MLLRQRTGPDGAGGADRSLTEVPNPARGPAARPSCCVYTSPMVGQVRDAAASDAPWQPDDERAVGGRAAPSGRSMTARTLTVGGRHLPARPAEHPRSAAARRGRDHHDPRPRPGRAALRRHDPADPGGDPDLRDPRGRPDLPSEPGVRVARQRDADRERRRADPARRRHAVRRSVEHLRLAGVRRRRRALAPDEVRHQVPRLARVQPVEHRPGRGVHRARQHARRAARLLVGAAQRLDAHRLRGHHHRRAADHQAAAPPRPGGDVLADAERRARDPRRHRATA